MCWANQGGRRWAMAGTVASAISVSVPLAQTANTIRRKPSARYMASRIMRREDETGSINIIVWRHVRERQRTALLRSRLLAVAGQWQSKDGSTHLIARRLVDMTSWLGSLTTSSRDFH